MTATVIRDFLVSLGYKVNKSSEQTFNDSLKKTTENAVKLGLAIETAAAAVTGAVVKMAQGMEQSYYQSKRLGGSVKDINAVSHAISQVGGNADAAKQSMENIAAFMRRLPGGKSYIQKLIGTGTDAGNVPAVMAALAKQFTKMPYAQAKVRADFLGIDENTLQAMIRDGGRYYDEYQKLAKRAGVDQQKYAEDSKDLMVKVRSLGASFDILAMKINSALIAKAGPYVEKFKNWFERNFDSIIKTVTKVVDVIMLLSDRIGSFVTRAMEWYDKLDPKSRNLVNTITAVAGAIWLFNKAFGASPVGRILALAAAIGVLYDDYQNWKKTGEVGLVDWSKWEPTIQSVTGALETISGWFITLAGDGEGGIGALQIAMAAFAAYMATTWALSVLASIARVKGGLVGLGAILLAQSAYNIYDTYNKVTGPQDDAFKQWDEGRSKHWYYGSGRKLTNWLYGAVGAEKPYDENLRTKNSSGKGGRAGGGVAPPTDAEKKRIAQMAFDKAIADGYTPAQAAGFVANIAHESNFNPRAVGDGGRAYGLFQHHPDRRAKIKAGSGIDIANGTAEQQIDAALWELRNSERAAGQRLRNAKTAAEAGGVVSEYYERPADKIGQKLARGATAERFFTEMTKGQKAAQAKKEQEDFLTERLSSLPEGGLSMNDGPFAPSGMKFTAPLMPDNVANTSTANMDMKTEITIMGNADAKQVQEGVEKGGRVLLRNMQPAIR